MYKGVHCPGNIFILFCIENVIIILFILKPPQRPQLQQWMSIDIHTAARERHMATFEICYVFLLCCK